MTTNVTHLCSRPEVDRPFRSMAIPFDRSTFDRSTGGFALTPVAHGGRYRVDVASFLSFSIGLACFSFWVVVTGWRKLELDWASPLPFLPSRIGAAAYDAFGACFRVLFLA